MRWRQKSKRWLVDNDLGDNDCYYGYFQEDVAHPADKKKSSKWYFYSSKTKSYQVRRMFVCVLAKKKSGICFKFVCDPVRTISHVPRCC